MCGTVRMEGGPGQPAAFTPTVDAARHASADAR
jgi:hypothetical protein